MLPRVAVVGGGISGLAAAHRVIELSHEMGRAVDVVLFEASDRLGGVFGTEVVDGYRLELGADMFITDKPWGLDLCRRLGLADQRISPDPRYRKSLILCRGRPVPTPEGFNLMVPGRLWPIVTTPLLSPLGKLRVLCEPFVPPKRDERDESLAEFVRRRLGREALERIVQPLVGGIYTGDPEQLSLQATLPRFQRMERESGSLRRAVRDQARRASSRGAARETSLSGNPHPRPLSHRERGEAEMDLREADGLSAALDASGARYGLFVSLREGMGSLQQALVKRVRQGATIRLGTNVRRIRKDDAGRFSLIVASGAAAEADETFDAVVLAVPSHVAADLITAWRPELAARLREIEYASSAIVVTGHRLADVAHPLDAYGLVVPRVEQRRILAVSFLSRKFPDRAPADRVVLRTFVGGALQPELMSLSDDELAALVREELRVLLGVRGEPEVCRVVRYERAMPQYHVGHLDRVRRIEELAAASGGLALCGNAYHGVGLPDCIHDGERAAERVWDAWNAPGEPGT